MDTQYDLTDEHAKELYDLRLAAQELKRQNDMLREENARQANIIKGVQEKNVADRVRYLTERNAALEKQNEMYRKKFNALDQHIAALQVENASLAQRIANEDE
jgi:flagellar capping protein FliD